MSEFIAIILSAAFAENIVLAKMLGLCPFIGLSKRLDVAAGVGAATTAVLTLACMAAWLLELALPTSLQALRPLVLIAVVAVLVQTAEMLARLYTPLMHRHLGIFLPLIATNCAVLGVMLLALRDTHATFWQTTAMGAGGGLGFLLAVCGMALLRARIVDARVPALLRGAPLTMLTAGFMALAFSGLTAVR